MPEYKGTDGLGKDICLKSEDIVEVTQEIAKLLLQRYSRDFEIVLNEKPAFAPEENKQLKKTSKFKSK